MTIHTVNKKNFELLTERNIIAAKLIYTNNAFDNALIEIEENYLLTGMTTGIWTTYVSAEKNGKMKSRIRVEMGGVMSIGLLSKRKKYFFKKSTGWKLRFSLINKEGEDLLTLIPAVNWQKESHDFILQLNEEFEKECDSFLILQAVHCANCSLSMMTGGQVPPLVSV